VEKVLAGEDGWNPALNPNPAPQPPKGGIRVGVRRGILTY